MIKILVILLIMRIQLIKIKLKKKLMKLENIIYQIRYL